MTPRLNSSKIWTPIPAEFAGQIRKVFTQQFKTEAQHGEFLIEGRIYPEEVALRIGYLESGRLKQVNFEASMDLPKKTEEQSEEEVQTSAMDRVYTCIDAVGSLLEEYFQLSDEDEIDVPLRWRPYEFEGQMVYLQHSTVNTRLEEEADRLLGLDSKRLVQEEAPTEDALGNADIDTELALEIQKAIREGRIKLSDLGITADDSEPGAPSSH